MKQEEGLDDLDSTETTKREGDIAYVCKEFV